MSDTTTERCTERVYSGERHDFGGHQCTRKAVAEGKCAIHSPAAKQKRDQEASARYEAARLSERRQWAGMLRRCGWTVIEPESNP